MQNFDEEHDDGQQSEADIANSRSIPLRIEHPRYADEDQSESKIADTHGECCMAVQASEWLRQNQIAADRIWC